MTFFVLGDDAAYASIAETYIRPGWRCIGRHPSGRPWIVQSSRDQQPIRKFAEGENQIVLMGSSIVLNEDSFIRGLARSTSLREIAELRRYVAGDFTLLASTGREVLLAGTLSRTRRISYAFIGGVAVFSDLSSSLARLGRFGIDESLVSTWLLTSYPPHPLDDQSLWSGVTTLPPGNTISLLRSGALRQDRYWSAPEPDEASADSAPERLATALSLAVQARSESYSSVSSDLSGGLDSTSLAFLLRRHRDEFATVHSRSDDELNADTQWAEVASQQLSGTTHYSLAHDASPSWYTQVTNRQYSLDTPDPMARTQAKSLFLHQQAIAGTPHCRLNGTGGDELFSMDLLGVHEFARQEPRAGTQAFREFVYARHDLPRAVGRRLRKDPNRNRAFREWHASLPSEIVEGRKQWSLGWEVAPIIPKWITPLAWSQISTLLNETANTGTSQPLSPHKFQHEILKLTRVGGDVTRRMSALASEFGTYVESPFLDEAIVQIALQTPLSVHVKPGKYKPLLAAAMEGIVPRELVERQSKGGYNRELYAGLKDNREPLLELFGDDSRLAQRGMIDRELISEAIRGFPADVSTFMQLDATIGVELWLRDLENLDSAHAHTIQSVAIPTVRGLP